MKILPMGLMLFLLISICSGQSRIDTLSNHRNVVPHLNKLFKYSLHSDSIVLLKKDSALSMLRLRAKYISYLTSMAPDGFESNSSVIQLYQYSERFKVSPIYQPPSASSILMYKPARDMPKLSNDPTRGRRPDTPYYLRANRYDWMIYRGN